MKKIDVMRNEISLATRSADSLEEFGRQLVVQHPEYRQHVQNGMELEDIAQSYIEEQMRIYFAYTLDQVYWETLVGKTLAFSRLDRNAMAPMFSPWGYLHSDLEENIGAGFGWTYGSQSRNLDAMEFPTRMRLITSTMEALSDAELTYLGTSLGLEEGVAPKKQGGCYVATAIYGSYDAPEVLVLRRWRDDKLRASALGRQFIRFYYATSPKLVKTLGSQKWFVAPSRVGLDRLVARLERSGYSASPYEGE
ncbi:CFI-box-CTERM domain-containing protein [Microbacterium sp. AR7-10]|uniref:CFI-box-CTERM domain-containing protein n=1 Tax=Microbacterium sp. AR7-10 TaxID=1891970 RepID=UPI000ADBD1CE|nr:CFI-box-CTERM domain-containing protein [Microbacterium sp. AR7-10]